MGNERRKNTRVPFQATADVVFADKSYDRCETENLSIKGVSVIGVSGHSVGETCDIALALSGFTSELIIRMKGEVVRVGETTTGLHFSEIDLDSYYHLKNIVYYNSEDPDIIEKELRKG